jgi:hypothetical protein
MWSRYACLKLARCMVSSFKDCQLLTHKLHAAATAAATCAPAGFLCPATTLQTVTAVATVGRCLAAHLCLVLLLLLLLPAPLQAR